MATTTEKNVNRLSSQVGGGRVGLWCLMPLSTIFQLNLSTREYLSQVTADIVELKLCINDHCVFL